MVLLTVHVNSVWLSNPVRLLLSSSSRCDMTMLRVSRLQLRPPTSYLMYIVVNLGISMVVRETVAVTVLTVDMVRTLSPVESCTQINDLTTSFMLLNVQIMASTLSLHWELTFSNVQSVYSDGTSVSSSDVTSSSTWAKWAIGACRGVRDALVVADLLVELLLLLLFVLLPLNFGTNPWAWNCASV